MPLTFKSLLEDLGLRYIDRKRGVSSYDLIPNGFLFQPFFSPYRIDRGINEQFENERGEDTPDHRSGHPLHDFRSGSVGPQDGNQADAHGGKRHEFGTQPAGCSFHNRVIKALLSKLRVLAPCSLVREIKVEQHEHSGFGIDPEKGENAEPYSNAHVVAERRNHPDGAHGGEWNRQGNDHGFHRRSSIAVKHKQNDRDSDWHDEHQSMPEAKGRFILATPQDRVASGELQLVLQFALCLFDVITSGDVRHVDENILRK